MSQTSPSFQPGGDAKAISRVAKEAYGGFREMFEAHGWGVPAAKLLTSAPALIVDQYGSIAAFVEAHAGAVDLHIWNRGYSVLLTSFWGWAPETWGAIGWTGNKGRTRRSNLLKKLTDPLVAVIYVTENKSEIDPDLEGKFAGFYLISRETGDRDEFLDPVHQTLNPEKWRHSLRALRAFSYLPEHRLDIRDFDPSVLRRARSVSAMGEIIEDPHRIQLLAKTPWTEVEVYTGGTATGGAEYRRAARGYVSAGPASRNGHVVAGGTEWLPRELYVLRLKGDTGAYLGYPSSDRSIFKVGLAASPESRRQSFQKAMPRGSFNWTIKRTTRHSGRELYATHSIAVHGEDAMKRHLAAKSERLGGEFYLASEDEIEAAWDSGCMRQRHV